MSSQADGHDEARELAGPGRWSPPGRSWSPSSWPSWPAGCPLSGYAFQWTSRLARPGPGPVLERVAELLAQAAGLTDPDDRLLKAIIRP